MEPERTDGIVPPAGAERRVDAAAAPAEAEEDDEFEEERDPENEDEMRDMGVLSQEQRQKEFGTVLGGGAAAGGDGKSAIGKQSRKAINEIARRQRQFDDLHDATHPAVVPEGETAAAADDIADDNERRQQALSAQALAIDGQTCFVLNVAHRGIRPIAPEAAFRVCGWFEEGADARRHALALSRRSQRRLTCFTLPRQQWFLLSRDAERYRNAVERSEKTARILAHYDERRRHNEAEFQSNVQQHRMGETVLNRARPKTATGRAAAKRRQAEEHNRSGAIRTSMKERAAELQRRFDAEGRPLRASDALPYPREMELRRQNCVAAIVLQDPFETQWDRREPLVCLLAGFESDKECQKWIDTTAKDRIRHHHIECLDLYNWVWPSVFERSRDRAKEIYRKENEGMQELTNRRKIETNRVDSFKQWCQEAGITAPVTEISRDGKVSGTDMHGNPVRKVPPLSEPHPLDNAPMARRGPRLPPSGGAGAAAADDPATIVPTEQESLIPPSPRPPS